MQRLYFAGGINMNSWQMKLKCSQFQTLGVYRLPGYRLAFFEHSTVWDGGMETLVPDEQSDVWGVLYELTPYSWDELDNCEDVRLDGTGAYFHYPVEVFAADGSATPAIIYLKSRWGKEALPSLEYMKIVLEGASTQGLPAAYLEELRRIQAKPAAYPVPRRPSYERCGGGSCSFDCNACGS